VKKGRMDESEDTEQWLYTDQLRVVWINIHSGGRIESFAFDPGVCTAGATLTLGQKALLANALAWLHHLIALLAASIHTILSTSLSYPLPPKSFHFLSLSLPFLLIPLSSFRLHPPSALSPFLIPACKFRHLLNVIRPYHGLYPTATKPEDILCWKTLLAILNDCLTTFASVRPLAGLLTPSLYSYSYTSALGHVLSFLVLAFCIIPICRPGLRESYCLTTKSSY
jgi:hypothetical protein